jgi:hypothetical protein
MKRKIIPWQKYHRLLNKILLYTSEQGLDFGSKIF